MSKLRGFQTSAKHKAYEAWQDPAVKCVLVVMPTGSGKTVLMGDMAREYTGHGCIIAHRSELVSQISVALAREGVRHDIIAAAATIRGIVQLHMRETGRNYYDARAKWKVASVDTLIRRELDPNWLRQVGMVMGDEFHHFLQDNKWGRAIARFPSNPCILGVTATPERADRKGLGRHAHGLVDAMVEGPNMRWMIDNAYLTDYRIIAPTVSDLDLDGIDVSPATGEYNHDQVRRRVKGSRTIIGDIVATYKRHAAGLKGICFAVDVDHATQIAEAFVLDGVAAQVVHAETPDAERFKYMRQLETGELKMLVNVDLFGEGVDVPGIQVVIMARPTASYGLYCQMFGRMLRLMISKELAAAWDSFTVGQRKAHIAASDKPTALLIDHVQNIIHHHGPPDFRKEPWSLDDGKKRGGATDGIPLRACINIDCLQPYERIYPACPYCGQEPPPPKEPTRPEHVDGDMVLYTQEMLDALFGAKEKVDGPCYIPLGVAPIVAGAIKKNHKERQEAQAALRHVMGLVLPPTLDVRVAQRRFFHTYGIDVLTAQSLNKSDAQELSFKILEGVRK